MTGCDTWWGHVGDWERKGEGLKEKLHIWMKNEKFKIVKRIGSF